MNDTSKRIGAIENAYEILLVLQEVGGLTLSEVTQNVDLSKSAVHKQLMTLDAIGFVNREENVYQLGCQLLTLGGLVQDRSQLYQAGRSTVDELSQEVGELCSLTIEDRGDQLVLYQVRSEEAVATDIRLGHRASMYCTATGKAMLAFLDPYLAPFATDSGNYKSQDCDGSTI